MTANHTPAWALSGKVNAPVALRPIHVALAAFVVTLPAATPTLSYFSGAPQFAVLADTFSFAFLLAALVSALILTARGLRVMGFSAPSSFGGTGDSAVTAAYPTAVVLKRPVVIGAVAAYLAGVVGLTALLFLPQPWLVGALAAGMLMGAGLPWLLAVWGRRVASTMDRSLLLCAFVMVMVSFAGWLLTLMPPYVLAPLFCLLALVGTLPLLRGATGAAPDASSAVSAPGGGEREGGAASDATSRTALSDIDDADLVELPAGQAGHPLRNLASITWLPLAGLSVYAFTTAVMSHSAFGVMHATFLGGALAAAIVFGVCFLWGRHPLLPWCYRVLVPLLGAVFVVLGAFPASTFPGEVSIVALYLFYLVLAMLGCALFLAVIHARELPASVAAGFGCAVVAAVTLVGFILSQVLQVADNFGPWLTVITGAFIAVLLVYLGRTAWDELTQAHLDVRDGAAAGHGEGAQSSGVMRQAAAALSTIRAEAGAVTPQGTAAPQGAFAESTAADVPAHGGNDLAAVSAAERTIQDTLEERCAQVAAQYDLSPRETEILAYLARGFSPTYIAKALVLSVSTVRTHVRNIYRKLGIGKREELIHLIDGEVIEH